MAVISKFLGYSKQKNDKNLHVSRRPTLENDCCLFQPEKIRLSYFVVL
jgi:hypothetical protein